ncbi:type II CRISPR-associated endonuclease Cas1 [Candidatus Endomicrobiellum trichonymphae]|uniref:CRISPR-associated endonuclease Cas1 n=1 Tax=Endomicrobium trichonymphae TaxID=1408204 RepID=B1GZM4_ENDTX|nr:type II CRISPR-associated endonuclease Cas1 [Candidatus Endomicrobium trichonymphae]BAG13706.1 CRISPR-associated protein Cas1 [Candidatus Endomicrobium trichonymphae]
MSWRTVFFSKPCSLSVKNSQLYCRFQDSTVHDIPIEDISVIVLESNRINLTSALISECSQSNIVIFSCDSSHIPCGIYVPFNQHSRFTQTANSQVKWDTAFKNRIWQKIVKQKICNQAEIIKKYSFANYVGLKGTCDRVQSGDKTNCEAFAAKIYWESIFENFQRNKNSDIRNSALNYGYAIVRGVVARSLASSGFITCFGVHHSNDLNAFNLADDIIEPFRPFVDDIAIDIFKNSETSKELLKEHKQQLLSVLSTDCIFNDKNSNILTAASQTTESFMIASRELNPDKLLLPEFKTA